MTILKFGTGSQVVGLPAGVSTPSQIPPPGQTYAITDRVARVKPTLPVLGAAGSIIVDPSFGARILRVTDGNTLPGNIGQSFGTPSAGHQLAWSKNSSKFYLRGSSLTCLPFTFNPTTMQAARIAGAGDGGLVIASAALEPQFSWVNDNILFYNRHDQANDWPLIAKWDFNTGTSTDLCNVGNQLGVTISGGTYLGSLYSSETAPEKIAIIFGAGSQDGHYLAAVFEVGNIANKTVVDTVASTIRINGAAPVATNITLGFHLHHIQIGREGRYVILETTGGDIAAGKARKYVWDTQTNLFTAITKAVEGHSVIGWAGAYINNSYNYPDGHAYDNVQWLFRFCNDVDNPRDVIKNLLTPTETYIDGHVSGNNFLNGNQRPMAAELYRSFDGPNDVSPKNTTPWRAGDDEIISVQTDGVGTGTTIWRHCHHRCTVRDDSDTAGSQPFWYQPRVNISPDGKWALFTSNWERTLGHVGVAVDTNSFYRYEAFLVEVLVP